MKYAFVCLAFYLPLSSCGQNSSLVNQKDPFLVMQWIMKDPERSISQHAQSFIGKDNKLYFYLPNEFWKDTLNNLEEKEFIRSKFVALYLPFAVWGESVSGIDRKVFLTKAARESAWGTSRFCALSQGQVFCIKQKEFHRTLCFRDTLHYFDDGMTNVFVKAENTREVFKLFLLTVTQTHYVSRLHGGEGFFAPKIKKWRKGVFEQIESQAYPAIQFLDCLCGYPINNWATNCDGDTKWLKDVENILKE